MIQRDLAIINRLGLHARATAKLVQLLSAFRCQATVVLRVDGEDEQAAADAVAALFERRFDEDS